MTSPVRPPEAQDLGPAHLEPASPTPLVSVLVPVYRTALPYLTELIRSVRAQRDPDWELLLVDDCSADPGISALLARAAAVDTRVRVAVRAVNGGIVAASNDGLAMARGEFVALLDHDDFLHPDAVLRCRQAVQRTPTADVLYTDEWITDADGVVQGVFCKPVFSPERLRRQNFTLHLSAYRRTLLERIGGFREGFDGSQDYDLILRASEHARELVCVPHALYSWRTVPTSVSHSSGNDYVFDSAVRAVRDHLDRTGIPGRVVQVATAGRYRIDRDVPAGTTVSVVLLADGTTATDDLDRVGRLAAAVVAEAGSRLVEVTVLAGARPDAVDLTGTAVPVTALEAALGRWVPGWAELGRVETVADAGAAAADLNRAVADARGTVVVLVTDAVRPDFPRQAPRTRDRSAATAEPWLAPLLGLLSDPGIGIVGPRVLTPQDRLVAAGLAVDDGQVDRIGAGETPTAVGQMGGLVLTREVTALPTAVLAVEREAFLAVGGLWTGAPTSTAVVDLCLKLRTTGRHAVVCAESNVRLTQAAAGRREVFCPAETAPIASRWGSALHADPFWRRLG